MKKKRKRRRRNVNSEEKKEKICCDVAGLFRLIHDSCRDALVRSKPPSGA